MGHAAVVKLGRGTGIKHILKGLFGLKITILTPLKTVCIKHVIVHCLSSISVIWLDLRPQEHVEQ